jgi:hypothetical protein
MSLVAERLEAAAVQPESVSSRAIAAGMGEQQEGMTILMYSKTHINTNEIVFVY